MARNTTTVSDPAEPADRALLRASALSWRGLAITVAALMLIAPLLVIGVFVLVETALSSSRSHRMDRSVPEPAPAGWRAGVPHLMSFRPHDAGPVLQRT